MEQVYPELLRQAGFGFVAGVFFWLYMTERNDHKQTRKEKDALMEARRMDARETLEKVEGPLSALAQTTKFIAEKIEDSKRRRA